MSRQASQNEGVRIIAEFDDSAIPFRGFTSSTEPACGQGTRLRTDLSRAEMIALVGRITQAGDPEHARSADIELFIANCKHPAGRALILGSNELRDKSTKSALTIEQIVDRAISGKG